MIPQKDPVEFRTGFIAPRCITTAYYYGNVAILDRAVKARIYDMILSNYVSRAARACIINCEKAAGILIYNAKSGL